MKKRLLSIIAATASAVLLMAAVSCKMETVSTEDTTVPEVTATGKISGAVLYSNVEGKNHGGITLTLDKTDGLSTRAVIANKESAADGSYLFENLEPGTYTVYAASTYSSERAVCTNVVVRTAETTVAETLKLTATGSISGNITLDYHLNGNTGFMVFVAGTSYMAMTDDDGNYTITEVPAGEGYQVVATKNGVIHNLNSNTTVTANDVTMLSSNNFTSTELDNTIKGDDGDSIVWKGEWFSAPSKPKKNWAYFNTTDGCSYIYNGNEWTLLAKSGTNGSNGNNGTNGDSIVWKGERSTAPSNPETNWAYFNTTDGCSYIWNGTEWNKLSEKGENGENGISIVWKGELLTAPANAELNWAYFNITDGCSYIWNGTKWDKLSEKGETGTTGETGANVMSIIWKGELLTPPTNPELNWAYFNTTDGCSYIWNGTKWDKLSEKGESGENGVSIVWKGELLTAPANPELNWAYYNTIDNCSYIYDGEKWNLLAKGISDNSSSGAVIEGTTLTGWENPEGDITIPSGVTSIGDEVFYGCSEITSIVIPDSVTSIGVSAFDDCDNLTSVTIGNGVTSIGAYAFYGCTGLTSITIPDSVTSIGNYAFRGCSGLTSITIPDSVTSIERAAFYGCSGLTGITIPDSVTSIGKYAFSECSGLTSITISDSVTSIGNHAFEGCSGLTSVTIPDRVTSIGTQAFYECIGLTSVTIGNGVTSIGNCAFEGCTELTSITIPDNLTSIGGRTFYECSGLTSITIPGSVTSIETEAFYNCSGLTSVNYEGTLEQWLNISFGEVDSNPLYYAHHLYIDDTEVTDLVIPEGVTSIGNHAFEGCSGLTSVTIPKSVTSIGSYAFLACDGLTSITIPDSVTSVGYGMCSSCINLSSITLPDNVSKIWRGAFRNCSALTSITIPDTVTSIEYRAFQICSGLTSITIPASVTSIEDQAFKGCDNLTTVNYCGSAEQWAAISIGSDNSALTGATTINYNYTGE